MQRFSALNRQSILQAMAGQTLDLLVIGGGVTGAGIALDASKRGIMVGLIEKNDFGSGTSSRSTKLIHGGLRYLKQGEIKLVQEVGRERAILHKNAPHLVIPAPMLLPIYKRGTYGYFASSIGLYLYDWLAGVARKERRKMLSRDQTTTVEPLLKTDGLKGAGLYYEYRTDDARLTLDIIKTAAAQGALAVNYAKAASFIYRDGKAVGVQVEDVVNGGKTVIFAKHIVNAAGPWVDEVRTMDGSLQGKRLFLTKGVHIVIDYNRLPIRQSAYFDTPDGRMIFVIPRGRITYVGTTDTAYAHSIDNPRMTLEDRDYLLHSVNAMFPSVNLTEDDILSHWAGLRPLIYEEGKSPSELSRKDEIFVSDSGLITIAGGKLTGFRKMAEKVVDLVSSRLHDSYPVCTTDHIIINGGEHPGYSTFAEWTNVMLETGRKHGIDENTMRDWIEIYGSNALKVVDRWRAVSHQSALSQHQQLLQAQILYSIEEEMTTTAVDFLRLRTGWSYFQLNKAEENKEAVFAIMSEALAWDADVKNRQRLLLEQLFRTIYELPDNDNTNRQGSIQASPTGAAQ